MKIAKPNPTMDDVQVHVGHGITVRKTWCYQASARPTWDVLDSRDTGCDNGSARWPRGRVLASLPSWEEARDYAVAEADARAHA